MVSIIVPVYRAEAFLSQCVGSILAQSCADWELLLIDDGSPDGSGAICDGYAARDLRVRVVHQENRGAAAARNVGLTLAKGEFITFCDADDFWEPNHLEGLLAAARRTGAKVVSCNYKAVDEQGNFLRESKHISGVVSLKTEQDRLDYMIRQVLDWHTGWEVWSRLFSTDLLRRFDIRFCETCGDYGEDLAFVLAVCLYADTVCGIPDSTCCYRLHPDSITAVRKAAGNLDSLNRAARWLFRYYGAAGLDKTLFPILHYGMLRGEYEKIPAAAFPAALETMGEKSWFLEQIRGLLGQRAALYRRFGVREAGTMLSWARFCIHRRPLLFRLEKCILSGDLFRRICGILRSET